MFICFWKDFLGSYFQSHTNFPFLFVLENLEKKYVGGKACTIIKIYRMIKTLKIHQLKTNKKLVFSPWYQHHLNQRMWWWWWWWYTLNHWSWFLAPFSHHFIPLAYLWNNSIRFFGLVSPLLYFYVDRSCSFISIYLKICHQSSGFFTHTNKPNKQTKKKNGKKEEGLPCLENWRPFFSSGETFPIFCGVNPQCISCVLRSHQIIKDHFLLLIIIIMTMNSFTSELKNCICICVQPLTW